MAEELVRLWLPWPPSVNRLYRAIGSRSILSQDARNYYAAARQVVFEQQAARGIGCQVVAAFTFWPPTKREYDVDNRFKALFDALEKSGVVANDKLIRGGTFDAQDFTPNRKGVVDITLERRVQPT
ncbi:MAG: RusA family crossover junction endodeoxyribonuclease [Planctomycetota bacterium]